MRQRGATVVTGDGNRVEVRGNGMSGISPPIRGMLRAAAKQGGLGYVRVHSHALLDCGWDRHLFWREGRWVAVLDDVAATRDGTYEVSVRWQLPKRAEWQGRILSSPTANGLQACVATAEDRPMPTSLNPLRAGESLLTRSLLFASGGTREWDLLPLGSRAAAVSGPEPAILGLDGYCGHGIEVEAPAFFLSGTEVWLQGKGYIRWEGFELHLDGGEYATYDLGAGRLVTRGSGSIRVAGRATRFLATAKAPKAVPLPAGVRAGLGRAIAAIVAECRATAPAGLRPPDMPAVPAIAPAWEWAAESAVAALHVLDGAQVLVGTTTGKIHCLTDGKPAWSYDTGLSNPVACLAVARSGEGLLLLAGCGDRLFALDGAGRLRWKHQCEAIDPAKAHLWSKTPAVCALLVDDLDGDGRQQIVLRNAWGNLERLSLAGEREGIYVADSYIGPRSRSLAAADFLPDPGKEVIAPLVPAWHGPYDQVHSSRLGKILIEWTFNSDSPEEAQKGTPHNWLTEGHERIRVVDLDGDGRREYLCTRIGQWNQLKAYDLESQDDTTLGKAKCLWAHSFGAAGRPNSLLVERLEGTEELSVLTSTVDGWVLAFDAKGRWRWSTPIVGGISSLAPLRSPAGVCVGLLAATPAGQVYRLTAQGRLGGVFRGAPDAGEAAWVERPGVRPLTVLGTTAGRVCAFPGP